MRQNRQMKLRPIESNSLESSRLVLRTQRLVLRGYRAEDLAAVHRFASDPQLSAYVEWGPNTPQDSRNFLTACLAEKHRDPRLAYTFAITAPDGGGPAAGEPFGSVGLTVDDDAGAAGAAGAAGSPGPAVTAGPAGRTGEVGYVIAADRWGRGYATEAAAAVVQFGFDTLGLDRISATCRPGNTASARVLAKMGMVLQTRLSAHKLIRGQWEDSLLYSLRRPGAS